MPIFVLITCATVLGFAATDLVLPAIPGLPALLGGTPEQGQYVLATFAAGVAAGLLLFGELGARLALRPLLVGALLAFGLISFAATRVASMDTLIQLRFLQGVASAAAAVFAPGIIRAVFAEPQAVRALGLHGSIEALVPALAPIAGAWLLARHGWTASFTLLAAMATALALVFAVLPQRVFPPPRARQATAGYLPLLRNRAFLRFGLSQAFTLGALLVIVLGAPAVMLGSMNGTLSHFIAMQMMGVASFIVAANGSGRLCTRFGVERVVMAGSVLSAAGTLAILAYALSGHNDPRALALLFVPVNLGLGLRGPAGFFQAILAARGDDARGAALVILGILLTTALGTAGVAPWIAEGLLPLAAVAAVISLASVGVLHGMKPRHP